MSTRRWLANPWANVVAQLMVHDARPDHRGQVRS